MAITKVQIKMKLMKTMKMTEKIDDGFVHYSRGSVLDSIKT